MKTFLLKLTALSLVATSVYAADEPVLRGSVDKQEVMVELQASCSQGTRAGQRAVRKLYDGNCDNAWDLERRANRVKDRSFPRNPRNWRERAYNQCARQAMDKKVRKIEKECLNNDTSQCEDLGEAAAEIIVFSNVCSPQFAHSQSKPDYKETCKNVAYGICKGQISAKISQYCSHTRVSSTKLLRLMDKCPDQVDDLLRPYEANQSETTD